MWALLIQTAGAWFSAGFIWTMQVLNYPLLALVGAENVALYESAHNRRFIAVVAPGVLVTLVTTILLLVSRPSGVPAVGEPLIAALLVMVIASTAVSQAPAHEKLSRGFDASVHRMLVRTNWIRTIGWTAIGALDVWLVSRAAGI